MCTISTCLSTSMSGSPMSRIVTSQPPHIENHSAAIRAAMLHLRVRSWIYCFVLISLLVRARPQFLDLLGETLDDLRKSRTFRCRYPPQTKPFLLHAKVGQHQANRLRPLFRSEIALLVVAVAGMAAAHEDAIGALGERLDDQIRVDHAGAHHAHHADAGRILDARNTGQVVAGIRAPVTAESDNHGLKSFSHQASPITQP